MNEQRPKNDQPREPNSGRGVQDPNPTDTPERPGGGRTPPTRPDAGGAQTHKSYPNAQPQVSTQRKP